MQIAVWLFIQDKGARSLPLADMSQLAKSFQVYLAGMPSTMKATYLAFIKTGTMKIHIVGAAKLHSDQQAAQQHTFCPFKQLDGATA